MKSDNEGLKQITFDLDTKQLEKYYPKKAWNKAYDKISDYMKKCDFRWVQGTVYVSEKPISSREITYILQDLVHKYPRLNLCMRDCRETEVGKEFERNYLFDKTVSIPTREELKRLERDGEDSNLVGEKEELKYKMSKLSMLLGSKELER